MSAAAPWCDLSWELLDCHYFTPTQTQFLHQRSSKSILGGVIVLNYGYIKSNRSDEAWALLKHSHHAFVLLWVIAQRARRREQTSYDLEISEALIGDCGNYGMTEREYRTAKKVLEKLGFATFKTTNKGTIATLCNTIIYDINVLHDDRQVDSPGADKSRSRDGRKTANKKEKNKENEKKKEYGDHVLLTEAEHVALKERFGERGSSDLIDSMNLYAAQIGEAKFRSRYKSHFATMINWSRRDDISGKAPRRKTGVHLGVREEYPDDTPS